MMTSLLNRITGLYFGRVPAAVSSGWFIVRERCYFNIRLGRFEVVIDR